MKIKKLISSVVLASTLLLNFSSTAFAITVAETVIQNPAGANFSVLDMAVSSSGVIHHLTNHQDGGENKLYWRNAFDAAFVNVDSNYSSTDVEISASMALDSSGNPGFVWREWDTVANTSKLYYNKHNGTVWGGNIEVATGLELSDAVPSLAFYRDGADTDFATIVTCGVGGGVVIAEYKATSSNIAPSFAAPVTISSNNEHSCSGSDLYVTSTDTLQLVVAPDSASTTAYGFSLEGGSWGSASTVFTGVDVQDSSRVFIDAGSNNEISAVIIDDAAFGGTDTILYNEFSGGSWGTQSTVASGVRIGQSQIDVVVDRGNGYPYVLYFDNANNTLKYAYSTDSGSNWTAANLDSGFTLGTVENSYDNSIAGDYYSGGTKIYAAAAGYMSDTNTFYSGYEITDLFGGGGQGGEGVPEFSTFVYITTVLLMFGMVYWKNEGGNMQNA